MWLCLHCWKGAHIFANIFAQGLQRDEVPNVHGSVRAAATCILEELQQAAAGTYNMKTFLHETDVAVSRVTARAAAACGACQSIQSTAVCDYPAPLVASAVGLLPRTQLMMVSLDPLGLWRVGRGIALLLCTIVMITNRACLSLSAPQACTECRPRKK